MSLKTHIFNSTKITCDARQGSTIDPSVTCDMYRSIKPGFLLHVDDLSPRFQRKILERKQR